MKGWEEINRRDFLYLDKRLLRGFDSGQTQWDGRL